MQVIDVNVKIMKLTISIKPVLYLVNNNLVSPSMNCANISFAASIASVDNPFVSYLLLEACDYKL